MTSFAKRSKRFVYFSLSAFLLVTGVVIFAGSLLVEEQRFAGQPKADVQVVESSRYLESGYYAPVDTDGDGKPDSWVPGDFQEGEVITVAAGNGEALLAEPRHGGVLSTLLWTLTLGGVMIFFMMLFASDPLESYLEQRRIKRWRLGSKSSNSIL